MSKPTPSPWTNRGRTIFKNGLVIANCGRPSDSFSEDDVTANATHIVKCVNVHEEVINLLDQLIEDFKSPSECGCDGAPDAMYACYFHRNEDEIRRLLAKAEAP